MAKGPLITRSELRKRQQAQASESLKKQRKRNSLSARRKKIASFYRKESKKNKPITKTRISERKRRPNGTLF